MIGGNWLPYLRVSFTRAFYAYCEPRMRIGGAGFERFSQQQVWLPQGLAAATVPGAISVVLLWLTVTLSNLISYATALFPLGKMDSHGRAHILTANLGLAFILPAQWPHASDYAALMAPTRARLFTLNS